MARSVRELEKELRSLHVEERNQLLRELIADVDDANANANAETEDIERLWLLEARQRYIELREGTVTPVPAETAIAEARSRLKNGN